MFGRYLIALLGVFILWFDSPIRHRDPNGALVMTAVYLFVFFGILLFYQFIFVPARARQKRSQLPEIIALAAEGRSIDVNVLLDSGVPVDVTGPHGETALMLAAKNNRVETVAILLARGASPDLVSVRGSNAAMLAKLNGHEDLAEMISCAPKVR